MIKAVFCLFSIAAIIFRFSFNKKVATGTGNIACTIDVESLVASSSTKRKMDNAKD